VRNYSEPAAYLLTIFEGEYEYSQSFSDDFADYLGCKRPETYNFKSIDEVISFLQEKSKVDATFEGVVLCDAQRHRWKVKNPLYLSLHHLKGNDNLYNPKYLLPHILAGNTEEILTYFSELEPQIIEMKTALDMAYINLLELWDQTKDIASQKEFALQVVPKTKFSSLLFQARKLNKPLEQLWLESEDLILKVLWPPPGGESKYGKNYL
jgi:hypothetical protein